MNQQILSQDEVDALLQGMAGDGPVAEIDMPSGETRKHDLAGQERLVSSRMPALEIVNERFARNIRSGVQALINKAPEVSIGSIKVTNQSWFMMPCSERVRDGPPSELLSCSPP